MEFKFSCVKSVTTEQDDNITGTILKELDSLITRDVRLV